jgi:hypothetical protein
MSAPYPPAIRPCRPSPWPVHSSRSAKVIGDLAPRIERCPVGPPFENIDPFRIERVSCSTTPRPYPRCAEAGIVSRPLRMTKSYHPGCQLRAEIIPSGAAGDWCTAEFQFCLCRRWVKPHCTMSAAKPLFHRKRKSLRDLVMSQMCQFPTQALEQTAWLFDHLVGGHIHDEPFKPSAWRAGAWWHRR